MGLKVLPVGGWCCGSVWGLGASGRGRGMASGARRTSVPGGSGAASLLHMAPDATPQPLLAVLDRISIGLGKLGAIQHQPAPAEKIEPPKLEFSSPVPEPENLILQRLGVEKRSPRAGAGGRIGDILRQQWRFAEVAVRKHGFFSNSQLTGGWAIIKIAPPFCTGR